MLLLGLLGRANHGKSTVADAIISHAIGYHTKVLDYDIGGMILRYAIENRFLSNKKRAELTPAEIQVLVDVGKELRETRGEHFWIEQVFELIDRDKPEVAIIPNVRYLNEAQWVKRRGGTLIRVQKLNANGSEFISTSRDPNHVSETELWNCNADYHLIAKDGESAWLSEQAITLFEYLEGLNER